MESRIENVHRKVYSLPMIDSETALIIEESLNIYPEINPGIEYHGDEKDILELLHLILIHPDTLRSWEHNCGIRIILDQVEVLNIDLEQCDPAEPVKEILFIAKMNESDPYQISFTYGDYGTYFDFEIKPVSYNFKNEVPSSLRVDRKNS